MKTEFMGILEQKLFIRCRLLHKGITFLLDSWESFGVSPLFLCLCFNTISLASGIVLQILFKNLEGVLWINL